MASRLSCSNLSGHRGFQVPVGPDEGSCRPRICGRKSSQRRQWQSQRRQLLFSLDVESDRPVRHAQRTKGDQLSGNLLELAKALGDGVACWRLVTIGFEISSQSF